MDTRLKGQSLTRELRLLKSVLLVSKKRDVRDTKTGKLLLQRGLVSKTTGKITKKGQSFLTYL